MIWLFLMVGFIVIILLGKFAAACKLIGSVILLPFKLVINIIKFIFRR